MESLFIWLSDAYKHSLFIYWVNICLTNVLIFFLSSYHYFWQEMGYQKGSHWVLSALELCDV